MCIFSLFIHFRPKCAIFFTEEATVWIQNTSLRVIIAIESSVWRSNTLEIIFCNFEQKAEVKYI